MSEANYIHDVIIGSGEGVIFRDPGAVRMSDLYDLIYPVGMYIDTSDLTFDPNVSFTGQTWVLEVEGMVHVSGGINYPVAKANNNAGAGESDGGSRDTVLVKHSHTVQSHTHYIPALSGYTNVTGSHTHGLHSSRSVPAGSSKYLADSTGSQIWNPLTYSGDHSHTIATNASNTGSSSPGTDEQGVSGIGANMQPHINVNRWHRVA